MSKILLKDYIYLSDNATLWLSNILYSRLGCFIEISPFTCSSYLLKIENFEYNIVIDSLVNGFMNPNSSLGFTYWNPSDEGFLSVLNLPLPAPGYDSFEYPLIDKQGNFIYLHYDLLGLIYWCLTRVEEYKDVQLDSHSRFPVDLSHAKKHSYLDRPIVDEWIEIFKQIIFKYDSNIKFKKSTFNIILSHDVDRPLFYSKLSLFNLVKTSLKDLFFYFEVSESFGRFYKWFMVRYKNRYIFDPFFTFDYIIDVAKENNLKCTFYFIAGSSNLLYDSDYSIDDLFIINLLKKINENGHYIGIHPSYDSFFDPEIIKKEIDNLIDICNKCNIEISSIDSRMHYLRFNIKNTMKFLSQNSVKRDSSLNYADESGFRCGTCFDYIYFDHSSQIELNIIERPLIVMDNNFIEKIRDIDFNSYVNRVYLLKERCKALSGNFTILWHNSELYNLKLKNIFSQLLR
jgi:hypothetical protein